MSTRLRVSLLLLVLVLAACSSDDGDPLADPLDHDSETHIQIAVHNWSSQMVSAEVIGTILETAGYTVDLVQADTRAVYQSMCDGEIDIVQEVWEDPFGLAFDEQVDKGCVLDWATHSAVTREDWWYPSYVGELCPGLPDWKALDECAVLFGSPENPGRGRFLTGPLNWLKGDEQRVAALQMNFDVIHMESASVLFEELESAVATRTPIVLFNWTPSYIEFVHDGSFVEFPSFEEECPIDPGWGDNPNLTHDCGNASDGYLKMAISQRLPERWPLAANLIARIDLTNEVLASMAALVDVGGLEPAEAAANWMAANPAIIALWTG